MDFMPLYEESIPGFKERIIFPIWNTQKNSAFFIRIIFMHFHIIALKVKFSMRRKNSHAESIMEESYEGNRNCTSD